MEKLKERQKLENNETYARRKGIVYEENYFHDFFRAIPFMKLKKLLDENSVDLNNKSILVASCGTGIDIHYLKKFYTSKYFATDLAENAITLVKDSFDDVGGQVEDNEALSFEDNSFDYSFIAAALHHLPRPPMGIYELLRVSKYGLIVIEPNDSLLTQIATKLGLASEIESEGNYVYRFGKREIRKIAGSLFYAFKVIRFWSFHRVAKSRIEFYILRIVNKLLNIFIPGQGNYIVFFIQKDK